MKPFIPIIVVSLAVVFLYFAIFEAGLVAGNYYTISRYTTDSNDMPPTKSVTDIDGHFMENNIIVAVHTHNKNIHFVTQGKGRWIRGIETYASSEEYSENATNTRVQFVKFKYEFPNKAKKSIGGW